jgi:hypothetical protein
VNSIGSGDRAQVVPGTVVDMSTLRLFLVESGRVASCQARWERA